MILSAVTIAGVSLKAIVTVALLTSGSVLVGLSLLRRQKSNIAVDPNKDRKPIRGADEPAPQGVEEYLEDLQSSCPQAPADFVLKHASAGATRDEIRKEWINVLTARSEAPTDSDVQRDDAQEGES